MRLIDADELLEHAWRDKLDSRELIAKMIDNAPTVKEIPTKIPLHIFEKLVSQDPCKDAISRQAVLNLAKKGVLVSNRNFESVCKAINDLPSVNPQDSKTEQFAKWVSSEIFDDNWEYNKDSFSEIACRKLAKLGIVKANGDEWELVRSQESEE